MARAGKDPEATGVTRPGERYANWRAVDDIGELVRQSDFDIVIVGGGGAGAAAAIEAADLGASVIVLEKMDSPGGSTETSVGTIRLVSEADRDGAAAHYWHLAQGSTPKDVIDTFVDGLVEIPSWIKSHGGETVNPDGVVSDTDLGVPRGVFPIVYGGTAFPNMPYSKSLGGRVNMRPMDPDRTRGAALWDFLCRNLAERDIPLVTGARVSGLSQDFPSRRVTGITVQGAATELSVSAQKGVILCSGGFSYDRELMLQYYGTVLPSLTPLGRATGDGVRMAQDVGADLWHMTAAAATIGYLPHGMEAGFPCKMPSYGFLIVDQGGERYVCETSMELHSFSHVMLAQSPFNGSFDRMPSFVILDDETRRSGTLSSEFGMGANRSYSWSTDNMAEVERGWITSADSLEELARQLELPEATLCDTVRRYNECCITNSVDQFGRSADRMAPIVSPPYYGAAVYPILLNTQGGPRRDRHGRVLRPNGDVIEGLYAAGELGSIWSRLYPGSGNIAECIVSGRLAAGDAVSGGEGS